MRVTDEMVRRLSDHLKQKVFYGTLNNEARDTKAREFLEVALSHAAGQEVVIRQGWLHWLSKDDPEVEDDYEIHDIEQCPNQPCPDCIPVSIVRGHLPAVVRSEGE